MLLSLLRAKIFAEHCDGGLGVPGVVCSPRAASVYADPGTFSPCNRGPRATLLVLSGD